MLLVDPGSGSSKELQASRNPCGAFSWRLGASDEFLKSVFTRLELKPFSLGSHRTFWSILETSALFDRPCCGRAVHTGVLQIPAGRRRTGTPINVIPYHAFPLRGFKDWQACLLGKACNWWAVFDKGFASNLPKEMFSLLCWVLQSLFVCLNINSNHWEVVCFCKSGCYSVQFAFENRQSSTTLQHRENRCIFPFVLSAFVLVLREKINCNFGKCCCIILCDKMCASSGPLCITYSCKNGNMLIFL